MSELDSFLNRDGDHRMSGDIDVIVRANEKAKALNRDPKLIPPGDYCYKMTSVLSQNIDDQKYYEMEICPYWAQDVSKEASDNGYCAFLQKGDWGSPNTSFLWDHCKECGVNQQ